MIVFEKEIEKARIKSPLKNFSLVEYEIEIRKDPLTSRICRINVERAKRPMQVSKEDFEKIAMKTKKKCPFCHPNIEKSTPKFFGMKERIFRKNSVVFPNLFPFGSYHAVVVLDLKKHYLPLNKINSKILLNSFEASIEFFKAVNEKDSEYKFASLNFNFLPSAAASIIHPHFQIMMDKRPTFYLQLIIEKSFEYYRKFSSNFWSDLIKEEEKKGERFIGKLGCFSWIADFAPIKNNQVSGIIEKKISSITELSKRELKDLCLGLEKIFKGLHSIGVKALNFSVFSGPIGEDISDYFLLNLKIISRPPTSKFYVSDIGFMELIHSEPVIESLPEDVAKNLRFK